MDSGFLLHGRRFALEATPAQRYAGALLGELGADVGFRSAVETDLAGCPQLLWARSGAMWLTGFADGPPLCQPVPVAACAQGAMAALRQLASQSALPSGAALLAERSAIRGLGRQGSIAPGGSCRLLQCADGYLALNLPRPDDWALLGALLGGDAPQDWAALATCIRQRSVRVLLQDASCLGLAVAPHDPSLVPATPWLRAHRLGRTARLARAPRVVDLSALWAGPLCGHLFAQLGAEVIKVESRERPDGVRGGDPAFFDLMNGGKYSVALALSDAAGRAALRELLLTADIVIESSRPRALQHMGLWAEELIAARPGLTWISITGYGRGEDSGLRTAYGDDAGVAGGLSAALEAAHGAPVFCGDAIADPLTGLHAALAGWAGWQGGGGCLLEVSMVGVIQNCAAQPAAPLLPVDRQQGTGRDDWVVEVGDARWPVARPRARPVIARAAALGADNPHILSALVRAC